MDKEKWSVLVQLYQYLKHVTLLAEELDFEEFKAFLQPTLEQRSALDHICRSMGAEFNLCDEDMGDDYSLGNIDKAISHLYRAFFDAADWLSMILRDRFYKLLKRYTNESIIAICPEYYTELRPAVERISADIAATRKGKDIKVEPGMLIDHVKKYVETLNELREGYNTLLAKVPSIQEHASKQKRGVIGRLLWDVLKIVIGAVIGFLFAKFKSGNP